MNRRLMNPLAKQLRKRVKRYLDTAEQLQSGALNEPLVHDYRIQSRELMAALAIITPEHSDDCRKAIKRPLKALNKLRDRQVQHQRFEAYPDLKQLLTQEIAQSQRQWLKRSVKLISPDLREQLKHLRRDLKQADAELLRQNAEVSLRHSYQVLQASLQQVSDAASIHQLRLRYKPYRYGLELLIDAGLISLSPPELKYWQQTMGEVQDLLMACDWLQQTGLQAGLLAQMQQELAQAVAQFQPQLPALSEFLASSYAALGAEPESLRLYLLRHAKSSWKDVSLPDKQRPLKARGYRDIVVMAKAFSAQTGAGEMGVDTLRQVEAVLCSTAVRAQSTWRELTEVLDYNSELLSKSQFCDALYTFDVDDLIKILRQQDGLTSLMLVGHNPALEQLLEYVTGEQLALPTCGFAAIEIPIQHWQQLTPGCGRLCEMRKPSMYR